MGHDDRAWDIVEKAAVCMMTTRFAGGLRARPLQPRPDRLEGLIWFVTDAHSAKDAEIAAAPEVGLVFIDDAEKVYLSITGHAELRHDVAKAREVWRSTDDVWWPLGPGDPNARVLRVEPLLAEFWDGPASKAVAGFEFVKARLTGGKPNLGENRKVTVPMQRSRR
jgi:general stress protein 26